MAVTALVCQDGQLINVFTQSDYAVVQTPFFEERNERIRYITGLRTREDRIFADACNLTRHDLTLEEPPLLGIHPFDLTDFQIEAERLDSILIDHVIGLSQANIRNKPALFCPMGIGGHRNHVSVLMAVINALPRLRELYNLYFYEDLHYASRGDYRNAGLLRFSSMLKGERLTRRVIALTPELFAKKMSLVGIYLSQHGGKLRASDFIPAATGIREPHEAVWALLP
jgi:hypothetical protein